MAAGDYYQLGMLIRIPILFTSEIDGTRSGYNMQQKTLIRMGTVNPFLNQLPDIPFNVAGRKEKNTNDPERSLRAVNFFSGVLLISKG
jgi:hypothetical protein